MFLPCHLEGAVQPKPRKLREVTAVQCQSRTCAPGPASSRPSRGTEWQGRPDAAGAHPQARGGGSALRAAAAGAVRVTSLQGCRGPLHAAGAGSGNHAMGQHSTPTPRRQERPDGNLGLGLRPDTQLPLVPAESSGRRSYGGDGAQGP